MEYRHIIKNFVKLSENLRIRPFIDDIFSKKLLSAYNYELLCSKHRIEQNIEFLRNIRFYHVLTHFEKWLKTVNPNLYEAITCGEDNSITKVQHTRLSSEVCRKNRVILKEHLDERAIVPYLYQEGLMPSDEFERMTIGPVKTERTDRLLNFIERSSKKPNFFTALESAIRHYQPHIMDMLV